MFYVMYVLIVYRRGCFKVYLFLVYLHIISTIFVFYKYVINKFVYLNFSLKFIYLRYYILTFLTRLMKINNIYINHLYCQSRAIPVLFEFGNTKIITNCVMCIICHTGRRGAASGHLRLDIPLHRKCSPGSYSRVSRGRRLGCRVPRAWPIGHSRRPSGPM